MFERVIEDRGLDLGGAAFELRLPRRHLVRMDVELLPDLGDRPLDLDRRDRLEARRLVPSRSSLHPKLLIRRHNRASRQAGDPPILPSEIVEPVQSSILRRQVLRQAGNPP